MMIIIIIVIVVSRNMTRTVIDPTTRTGNTVMTIIAMVGTVVIVIILVEIEIDLINVEMFQIMNTTSRAIKTKKNQIAMLITSII